MRIEFKQTPRVAVVVVVVVGMLPELPIFLGWLVLALSASFLVAGASAAYMPGPLSKLNLQLCHGVAGVVNKPTMFFLARMIPGG